MNLSSLHDHVQDLITTFLTTFARASRFWAPLVPGMIIGTLASMFYRYATKARVVVPTKTVKDVAPDIVKDITVKDFEKSRDLIVENIKIMETNETYVVAAIASLATFGVSQSDPFIFKVQATIVPIIGVLGALRWLGLRHVIAIADEYSRYVETAMPFDGWANFYAARSKRVLSLSRVAFWLLVLFATEAYALECYQHGPFTKASPPTQAAKPT